MTPQGLAKPLLSNLSVGSMRASAPKKSRRRYVRLIDGTRVLVVPFNGQDGHIVRWTTSCSGCDEIGEYANGRGSGCSECGYTGKRRREEWVPL